MVNDKFAFENFVISKSESAEATGDPAQTFSGGMGIGGTRISRADNLAQQNERRVGELVFFMSELNETSSP